jgi:hypothetical protein
VALPAPLADELGVLRRATAARGGHRRRATVELLTVAGPDRAGRRALAAASGYVFADIATAQELLGMAGAAEPDRPDPAGRPGCEMLAALLPEGCRAGRVGGALAGHLRHDARVSPEPHRAVAAGAAGRRVS